MSRIRCLAGASLVLAAFTPCAVSQILLDGSFDALTVGTNPDNTAPAGAWGFPVNYAGISDEPYDTTVTVVPTGLFDSGAAGNSLALEYNNDPNGWNVHLPNLFTEVINEAPGQIVTASFDIWTPTGFAGGSVYVGGDHGGGGFTNTTDRGPQITFYSDGRVTWTMVGGIDTDLTTYAFDAWHSVRFEIDLAGDTYDAYFGPRGSTLTLVGDNLTFRASVLDHLDRFTRVNFGLNTLTVRSYIDSVSVTLPGPACPGDLNGDNVVSLSDLTIFLANFGATGPGIPGDFNNDGQVTLGDLTFFLSNFGLVCSSAGGPSAPSQPVLGRPSGVAVDPTGP